LCLQWDNDDDDDDDNNNRQCICKLTWDSVRLECKSWSIYQCQHSVQYMMYSNM